MDFDKVHQLAFRLSELTLPENREECQGLFSWAAAVAQTWEELAELWKR